ncbi:MAG: hypothetical protein E7055_14845 [Lentisphaerae bacterium]|nr:hypothetical protein [Lentisphaerota bacterium]
MPRHKKQSDDPAVKRPQAGNPVFGRAEQAFFFLYLFAALILVFSHEPWEDELQVWCIAQELSIPEIFHQMRYEGHFALWYLLLKHLIWLHLPLSMLNILSWILCVGAAGMLLASRSFGKGVKILLLFSCPLLYWFPVVARNYALIPPALALLAGLYPVRLKKTFAYAFSLLLLVHSHAYMEGLAGILGVFFAWDLIMHCRRMPLAAKWKTAGVLVLIGAGVLAAFLQVAPAFGVSSFAPASAVSLFARPAAIPGRIWNVLIRLPSDYSGWLGRWTDPRLMAWLFYGALLAALIQLKCTRGSRPVIIFLAGFFWQVLFAALLYGFAMHRLYLPLLMLVFCYALPVRKKRLRNIRLPLVRKLLDPVLPVGVLCVMLLPDLIFYAEMDIRRPFSSQSQIAYLIERQLPKEAKIYVLPETLITGTFRAYLPDRVFYRCSDMQPFRLFRVQTPHPKELDDALLTRLMQGEEEIYLLFQSGVFLEYGLPKGAVEYDFPSFRMKLLFGSSPKAFFSAGEDYALFKVTRKTAADGP